MYFERLLELVGDEPVFESALLLAGGVNPAGVHLQLSRWVTAGRIYQLRRGLYALAPPFQKVKPHPFVIANRLVRASYVSCQSALAHYGLIPEYVPVIISATGARPARWRTPLGDFEFRHVKPTMLRGYRMTRLENGGQALVATPEKALLDLVYLQPGGDTLAYLQELRLQNLEQLDLNVLTHLAERTGMPKLRRAAAILTKFAQAEAQEYERL